MTISAKIIADSISPAGIRLTTMQLRYPKFIHGEAKTHRLVRIADKAYEFLEEIGFMNDSNFSRNASSSRAIPVERLIQDVLDDPAIPVFWGKNQPGMQANEECNEFIQPYSDNAGPGPSLTSTEAWLDARDKAIHMARAFAHAGYHKQIVNRLIEPWCHINVVVTATEWENFFALRRHKDAQPEMRALAEAMREARNVSTPKLLSPGYWHVPYVNIASICRKWDVDPGTVIPNHVWEESIKLSVSRCARVSYLTHEGKDPNVEDDLKLYDRLVGSTPLHASPAEHQATPDNSWALGWQCPEQHGNFVGWRQYRKMLPNENTPDR